MSRYTETTLGTETTEKLPGKGKLSRVTENSTVRSRDSSPPPLSIAERFMSIGSDTSTSSIPKVTNYNITTTSKPLSLDHGPLFSPLNHNMQGMFYFYIYSSFCFNKKRVSINHFHFRRNKYQCCIIETRNTDPSSR
jgi:hypothetical protein